MTTLEKVTFYTGCKINPNYFDTYRTQALMDSYLATLDSISINNPMFYIEFSGIISVSISGIKLTEGYNYMTAEYSNKEKLYFFITTWELRNGVVTMTYRIDPWHTFIENVSMKMGHRILMSYQSSMLTASNQNYPVEYIAKPLINGTATVNSMGDSANINKGYLFVQGYAYYGEKPASGKTSSVKPWIGAVTPSSSSNVPSALTLPQGEYYLSEIYIATYKKTIGSNSSWYFEITKSWFIPYTMAGVFTITQNGYSTLTVGSNENTVISFDDSDSVLKLYAPTEASTKYYANTIDQKFQYYDPSTHITTALIGTKNNLLPVEPIVGNQVIRSTMYLGGYSPVVYITYGSNVVDVTDDFIVEINFTPESALVAQQRKMEFIGQVASAIGGVASGVVGMGSAAAVEARTQTGYGVENAQAYLKYGYASNGHTRSMKNQRMYTTITSGNDALTDAGKGGRIAAQVGRGTEMAGSIMNLLASAFTQYSTVEASGVSESIFAATFGLMSVTYIPGNIEQLDYLLNNFGIATDRYVSSFEFDTSIDFDLQGYDDIYLEGKIPEQYLSEIEKILIGGTRVWNK